MPLVYRPGPEEKRPEQHEPLHIELTDEQKKAIIEYTKMTGFQPQIGLKVDVIEGKIAPVAVAVGAA